MGFKAHRVVTSIAWGCAVFLAASLASCAAPSFTYVADSGNSTYFKVPYGWKQVSGTDMCTELKNGNGQSSSSGGGNASPSPTPSPTGNACPGDWLVGYEPATKPSAHDFESLSLNRPFVFVDVEPYQSQTNSPPTDDTLKDFYLPVSPAARNAYQQQTGLPLSGFKSLRDASLKLDGGVHGVRETFDYAFPGLGVDTFDEVILANTAGTTVYLIIAHCTTTCYRQDKTAINDVMSSFTVRSGP